MTNQSFGFNWNEKVERDISDLEIRDYYDLDIEPGKKDKLMRYDESLQELRSKGYERHLMPWESFELIIDYFEGNLSQDLETLAKDMLESKGEWFDLFMERKGNKLLCYVPNTILEPEDVKWNDNKTQHDINEDKLRIDREFIIGDIPSEERIDLEQFKQVEGFIKYFYTREFDDLPEEMKKGNKKARVYLFPENVWPLCGGSYDDFEFNIDNHSIKAASRGVYAKNYTGVKNE